MTLLVGLLVAAPSAAQDTGTIAGTVIDARTQEPLADINVVVVGTLLGATTGPEGQFRIDDVPPDTYTVQVEALGYRAARWSVEVTAGETEEVTFRLTPAADAQDGREIVEAEALRPRTRVNTRQLREIGAADPGMAFRHMAGTGTVRHGGIGFDPNVRGLSEAQLGVFVDGARAFAASPLHADALSSHVDPGTIERIEVVKGPYALIQGAALMSAIEVETPSSEEATTGGWLQGGFRGNGQAAETAGAMGGAFFGTPFHIQGAYRTGQDYAAGNGQTVPARYESGAVRGRVDVPLTEVSRLSVSGHVQDQRDVWYPGLLLDAESITNRRGAARYRLDPSTGPVRHLEVQAYAMQALHAMSNEEKPRLGGTFDERLFDITVDAESQHFGGRILAELALVRGALLTVGSDAYHVYRDATRSLRLRETGAVPSFFTTEEVWPGVTVTDVGLFANGTRAFGSIDAVGTVRLDLVRADASRASTGFLENAGGLTRDDLRTSEANWSGMLALSTSLSPQWTLAAGVGSVARTADASERYSDRFWATRSWTRAEVQGDPALNPERSTQGDLWLQGELERGTVQLGGFARRIDDYITWAPTDIDPLLPFSPGPVFRYVNGTATFYGIDATGRYDVNPLMTLRGRASYHWGQDETLDEPAFGVMPLSADLGLRIQAPFNDELFLEGILHLATERDRVATTRGEVATDGYATLDLRLGFAPAARTSLIVSLENVTDVHYVYPLNARNPFSGVSIPEPGRTLGLNLRVSF